MDLLVEVVKLSVLRLNQQIYLQTKFANKI